MVILDPYGMTFDAVVVFGLVSQLFFKSCSSYCELLTFFKIGRGHTVTDTGLDLPFSFSGSTYREETEEQSSLNPEPKKSSKSKKKKRDKSKRRESSKDE